MNFARSPSALGDTDNMPAHATRVLGPYRSGPKWRIVCIVGGERRSKIFASQQEAQTAANCLQESVAAAASISVEAAIDEYLGTKRAQGLRPVSLANLSCKLRAHLDGTAELGSVGPPQAKALYQGWTDSLAVATHRMLLRYTRSFFAWCVDRGYLLENPFAKVRPQGRPRHGKPQLRIDEARALYADLQQRAQAADDAALGLLLMLLLGLRSAEVCALRARDVDDDASRLCVAMGDAPGKTAHAARTLSIEVPALRDRLRAKRQDLRAQELLLAGPRGLSNKRLRSALALACQRLGLPRVCPHSLRGLHASLAVQGGATALQVANTLGHGSPRVTQQHYIADGSTQTAQARRLAALIAKPDPQPGPQAPHALTGLVRVDQVLSLLADLSPHEREALAIALTRTT